ncbi:MAG: DNA repair protein RecO [Anaerolineaceae bacterium]|nr:DNA repair protein RecO [Anaerolineaceae bacterium]
MSADSKRSLKVEAVILQHSDWGEADRLLRIFSREQGKLKIVAKGVRRIRSRKAGHLEPITRVSLLLARGTGMWIVTQAETIHPHLALRADLLLTGYACYLTELVDRFTIEEEGNYALYQLFTQSLERLESSADPYLVVRFFEIHLLDLLGYRPELLNCVSCREPIQPQNQFFSYLQGGVICPKCIGRAVDAQPVSMSALKYMRHMQRSQFEKLNGVYIPNEIRDALEQLLTRYINFLLERQVNSSSFIRMVRNGNTKL